MQLLFCRNFSDVAILCRNALQAIKEDGSLVLFIEMMLDLLAVSYVSTAPVIVMVVASFLVYSCIIAFHVHLCHLANVGTREKTVSILGLYV